MPKQGRAYKKDLTKLKKYLQTQIETGKIIGQSYASIATEFNTTRQTVSKHIDEIMKGVKPEDVYKIMISFSALFQRLFSEAESVLSKASSPSEKDRAIKIFLELMTKHTDFLERFHLKEKALDHIQINGDDQKETLDEKKIFVQTVFGVIKKNLEKPDANFLIKEVHKEIGKLKK